MAYCSVVCLCVSWSWPRAVPKRPNQSWCWGVDSQGPKQLCIKWWPGACHKKDTFWGHTCTQQDLPTVDILDVVREGAGAMWRVATILLQRHVIITCRGHASGAGQTQPSAIDRSSPADWRMTCRWKYDEQVTGGCSRGLTVSSSSANYITTHTSHLHHTEQVPPWWHGRVA